MASQINPEERSIIESTKTITCAVVNGAPVVVNLPSSSTAVVPQTAVPVVTNQLSSASTDVSSNHTSQCNGSTSTKASATPLTAECNGASTSTITPKIGISSLTDAIKLKKESGSEQPNLALIKNNLASHILNINSPSAGAQQSQYFPKCIIKIKGEPDDKAPPAAPASVTPVVNGFAGLMGIDTPASNDPAESSDASLPPVRIGTCLLCGDALCGTNGVTCASDDENEEDPAEPEKDLLPPPPMSSTEVDKLFSKLLEQDKETPMEPCAVINTEMYLHQKQALQWMVNRENSNDLGPFWKVSYRGEWYNEGTRRYTSERPNCIKGGILADDMGLGKTLTIIALIFTNHINGKPLFLKKEVSSRKRKSDVSKDATAPQPKKPCINISSSEDETQALKAPKPGTSSINISSDEDASQALKAPKPGMSCINISSGPSCTDTSSDDGRKVKIEKPHKIKKEKDAKIAIKKRKESLLNNKRLQESKKGKNPGEKFRKLFLPSILKKKNKVGSVVKKEKSSQSSPIQKPIKPDDSIDVDDIDDDEIMIESVAKEPEASLTPGIKIISTNPASQDVAKATLIICPLSVLSNWTDQICAHVNPAVSLRVYLYYGAQRIKDIDYLKKQDIVLTTYPTIANDYRTFLRSPLHRIKWLRIILDEGHTIRNKRTSLSKSVLELEGERRWVITGTPIQNRIEDLWVLLLFLRLEPFNDTKWWKMMIANIAKLQNRKSAELADFRLNALIKHISIRRLKDEKISNTKLVELPPKSVVIQDITLSEEERKLYDLLQLQGQKTVKRYMKDNSVLKHYGHCFFIIMRLRQMCLNPRLCKETLTELKATLARAEQAEKDDGGDDDEDDSNAHLIKILMEAISAGDSEECAVCLESLKDPVITPCAHVFCFTCITDVLQSEGLAPMCPMCRGPVSETELVRVPEEQLRNMNNQTNSEQTSDDNDEDQFEGSAKMKALIRSLEALRDQDPSIKSIVVSQFTSFLNIVAEYLERHGFNYLRLDGTMSLSERTKALEDFSDDGSFTVFLLSMTAGGTGISLTAASRVFLMDPAWNPAVEEQCFDRCHRMGQTREVIITKYLVTNSIEERMLTLQDQKRALMTDAFGAKAQSEGDRRRTRVQDIAHLMGLQAPRPAVNQYVV